MSTPEILSKLTPKTQNYSGVGTGAPDLGWQDILQAMRGIEPGKAGFLTFIYGNNPKGRHDFYAGLFMEVMERPEVQLWIQQRKSQRGYQRSIESLCLLAILEWKEGALINLERAGYLGVSRATWNRKYRDIYQYILAIPKHWEAEVMRIVTKRLK